MNMTLPNVRLSLLRLGGALVLLSTGVVSPVGAAEFNQVLPAESSVRFVSKQMNVPVEGQFRSFRAQLVFDPARPAAGKADIELDVASIDMGLKEANEEAVGKDWFDAKRVPTARFVSSAVKDLGGGQYEISGTLTIKGKSLPVSTAARFTQANGKGTFAGSFVIKRGDFGLGQGMWADYATVANEVSISFRLVASSGSGVSPKPR